MSKTRKENLALLKQGLLSLLESNKHGLRDRQHQALLKLAASEGDSFYQGYFNQATGIGKTYEMATLIKVFRSANPNQKIVVLEEFIDMAKQTANAFSNQSENEYIGEGSENIGIFNGKNKDFHKPIIVATYASLKNLVKEINPNNVGLVIPDEAHRALSGLRMDNIKTFSNALIYAFTATPKYDEQKNLQNLLENELDELSIEEGIQQGLNSSVKNILLVSNISIDLSKVKKTSVGDYDDKEFDKAIGLAHKENIKNSIVEFWANFVDEYTGERANNRITMINCRNLKEAKNQAEAFNKYFGKTIAKAYGSELSDYEKTDVLRGFENADFPVICQVGTLGEGYNYPELSLCINYPTASFVREAQRSGRTLRIDPNNKHKMAWVVDIVFRHPDYADAPITIAAEKNNQVLFAHVAGNLEITSHDRKIFDKLHRRKTNYQRVTYSPLELSGFQIKSTTEQLLEIENADKAWNIKNEMLENAKRYLLSSEDLSKIFIAESIKIRELLKNLHGTNLKDKDGADIIASDGKIIPLVVLTKKNKKIGLYLNATSDEMTNSLIVQRFEEFSHLERRDNIQYKSPYMLTMRELIPLFIGRTDTLQQAMQNAYGQFLRDSSGKIILDENNNKIPLVLKAKTDRGVGLVLNGTGNTKLDNLIVQNFGEVTNLKSRTNISSKSASQKTWEDLTKIYFIDKHRIVALLKELHREILVDNENRPVLDENGCKIPLISEIKRGVTIGFALNMTGCDVIDKQIIQVLEKKGNLVKREDFPDKTEEMLTAKELSAIFMGKENKFSQLLKDNQGKVLTDENETPILDENNKQIPLVIKVKNKTLISQVLNATQEENINKAILDKFAKINSLKYRNPINVNICKKINISGRN